MNTTEFRRLPHTAPGLRHLSLSIGAPEFRHVGQAVRDALMWAVAGIIFLALLDVLVSSKPFLRAVLIGAGGL